MATPERGLKDHEIAQLVNAIRDNVVPICASQQLRARIESALTSKLGETGVTPGRPSRSSGATGATTRTVWVHAPGSRANDSHNRYNMNRVEHNIYYQTLPEGPA